jgi:hypothetical protein
MCHRRRAIGLLGMILIVLAGGSPGARGQDALPIVSKVSLQPLSAQAKVLTDALDVLGQPLSAETKAALDKAYSAAEEADGVKAIQEALDPLCLLAVDINPEARVKVAAGPAKPLLVEQGWRAFLIKVHNQAGLTAELKADSPQAGKVYNVSQDAPRDRWMDLAMYAGRPIAKNLSGLEVEYRIVEIFSRDAGKRQANLTFSAGQGTQDLGFRSETSILFDAQPSREVTFDIKDENGKPAMAGLTIKDALGRIYPYQPKRLAPDFFFHPQVYRTDGETVRLPDGKYSVEVTRGPEYIPQLLQLTTDNRPRTLDIRLKRWIDPAKFGYWSGDHHIHAAGCAHYTNPTEGVFAKDMMRHVLGEDLKVGCNLTWGPCFDFQKQFFTGAVDPVSKKPYLLRYDIEVSGFGSHQSGHLVLLRLKDQMYPGGTSKDHWPTLGLNTLKWAKKQGAVTGPAHSGNGLSVANQGKLPNYIIPPYNGIGANEFVVDITHQVEGPDGKPVPAIDFISTVDTDPYAELNMWYHSLNAGFRVRASGETDFPCIYGERVGMGRSYVKLDGDLDFDTWCENIRKGRNYVSDGYSHIIDMKLNDVEMGSGDSELKLAAPGTAKLTAKVAAYLREISPDPKKRWPVWHIERARIADTRNVRLDLVVNGIQVESKQIPADGTLQDVSFDVKIDRSSWVALRIFQTSHSNPIFAIVGDKPIRASRKSVQWCLSGVDKCWQQKQRTYKPAEMEDAKSAYEHAKEVYKKLLAECEVD